MPLIHGKSKAAFKENVETEMKSGKPQPQSLAIAYSVQRQAKKKKMAPMTSMSEEMPGRFAEGGEVENHYDGIADAIMRKRKKHMSDDGMVDINENAQESGQSPYDEDNSSAYDNEVYDNDQMSPQPMDSNMKGDDIDSDDHDMVGSIRKKMKGRKGPMMG